MTEALELYNCTEISSAPNMRLGFVTISGLQLQAMPSQLATAIVDLCARLERDIIVKSVEM